MKRTEFMKLAYAYHDDNPEQRWGQAVFNVAYIYFPHETNELRATSLDPFHNNGLVDAFVDALFERL